MKLIKNGKLFDLSTATLIATGQWYMSYGLKRRKLYKSVNGQFFNVQEETSLEDIRKIQPLFFFDFKHPFDFDIKSNKTTITNLMSFEQARDDFEYISTGKGYASNHYSYKMRLHVEYEDLFVLTEG